MVYISDYGKIWDTLYSFQLQFEPDCNDPGKAVLSQNRYGIEWVHKNCDIPPRELSIFFQKAPGKSISVLEYIFGHSSDELLGKPMETYLETVFNLENIRGYIMDYYFLDKSETYTLEEVYQILSGSGYSDECRYHLLGFCINVERYISILHECIQKRYELVDKFYEESRERIQSIQDDLSEDILKEMDQDLWNINTEYNQIYYSICLISSHRVERRGLGAQQGEDVCFTLGIQWKEQVMAAYKKNKVDLNLFGKILSEPNRTRIIEYLLEHDEITISTAVEYLKTSVTATNYHLNMMFDAKMLKTRYEGRKIYYSLCKDYFIIAIGMLRDLADQM